jgi:hypothetical protein
MAEWWVFAHGREMGPVTTDQLIGLARAHSVAGIYVWREGFDDWRPLGEIAEIRSRPDLVPERPVVSVAHPSSWKRLSIAALLIAVAIASVLYAVHAGAWKQVAELLKGRGGAPVTITETKRIDPPPADSSAADAAPSRDAMAASIAAAAPNLQTLKEKLPAQFDALVDDYADSIARGSSAAEALESVRGKLATFALSLMRQADDDVVVDYNTLLVDQLRAFNEKNPTYCYQYASGTEFSPTTFRELPAEIQRRDMQLQNRVLMTAREREAPQGDVVQRGLASVRKQLEESRTNLDVLSLPKVERERHGEYCEATIRFFSEIGKLPDQDKAAVMRFILGAKR